MERLTKGPALHRKASLAVLAVALVISASFALAGVAKGGTLMTQGSQYPATLHAASPPSEAAIQFRPTDGGGFFVYCSTFTATGTLGWARTTPALHPEFSGCKSGATGFGATITTTGCDFRLHIGSTIGETGKYDGTASIECEAGKAIKIVGDNCEILIDPQSARSTIELSNVAGSPGDVSVQWSLTGLAYTAAKDGQFFCALNGVGTKETGDLTSTTTLTAKVGGNAVGLTVEHEGKTPTEEAHLEAEQEATEHEATTEHEQTTEHEATTEEEAETAAETSGGRLMTQGSQYVATLHAASPASESAIQFRPTDGGEYFVYCSTFTATGTLGWATTTPALHPELSGCKSSSGNNAIITTTGCDFRLHIGTTIGVTGNYDGTASIECEAGKAITITSETCETRIDPQAARSTIELSNIAGSPGHVSVKWSLKGIAYTVLKDSFFCQLNGVGTKETGDLTSTTTLTAKVGGNAVGLTVEDP